MKSGLVFGLNGSYSPSLLFIFFLSVSVDSHAQVCPYQTSAEWQNFLKRYAENKNWVETCEDSICDTGFYDLINNNVQHMILHELSMPPDTGLSAYLERKEMKNLKLSTEEEKFLKLAFDTQQKLNLEFENSRFPVLKKWFLEKSCH